MHPVLAPVPHAACTTSLAPECMWGMGLAQSTYCMGHPAELALCSGSRAGPDQAPSCPCMLEPAGRACPVGHPMQHDPHAGLMHHVQSQPLNRVGICCTWHVGLGQSCLLHAAQVAHTWYVLHVAPYPPNPTYWLCCGPIQTSLYKPAHKASLTCPYPP